MDMHRGLCISPGRQASKDQGARDKTTSSQELITRTSRSCSLLLPFVLARELLPSFPLLWPVSDAESEPTPALVLAKHTMSLLLLLLALLPSGPSAGLPSPL